MALPRVMLGQKAAQQVRSLIIEQVLCLDDNYCFVLHCAQTKQTAVVDTPEAAPVLRVLKEKGWHLTHILNTHHHWDHVGANEELADAFPGIVVYGPVNERDRIPRITNPVGGEDKVQFGQYEATVMDTGGHTLGHIAYYFPTANTAFVGDALFTIGCGHMFEGTPPQYWDSLLRIRALPAETVIYGAHEYTAANLRFALSVDPHNQALQQVGEEVTALRAKGEPTVPSILSQEMRTNPFLRADAPDLRDHNALHGTPSEVFGTLRKMKDEF